MLRRLVNFCRPFQIYFAQKQGLPSYRCQAVQTQMSFKKKFFLLISAIVLVTTEKYWEKMIVLLLKTLRYYMLMFLSSKQRQHQLVKLLRYFKIRDFGSFYMVSNCNLFIKVTLKLYKKCSMAFFSCNTILLQPQWLFPCPSLPMFTNNAVKWHSPLKYIF